MAVKKFGVTPAGATDELYPGLTAIPFQLEGDDHIFTAHPPKRASWKRAQLSQRASVPLVRKIEVLVDFLVGCLRSSADADTLSDRLLDGTDALDYKDLLPVVTWLMSSWSTQVEQLKAGKPATAGLDDGEPTDPAAPDPAEAPAAAAPEVPAAEPAVAQPALQATSTPLPSPVPAGALPPVPTPAAPAGEVTAPA